MSSEVFSTAYLQAKRKAQLAREMRESIAKAAERIKKLSASISDASRLMQEQGDEISREIAKTGSLSAIDIRLKTTVAGQSDISGFTKEDISKLAEQVQKNTELLQTQVMVSESEIQSSSVVELTIFESTQSQDSTGFVKSDVSAQLSVLTPERKKIIQLSEILVAAKSKKDVEYAELLIVAFGILDEAVWTAADVKLKNTVQRRIERIDADLHMTVFEKIEKIKQEISEYVLARTPIPAEVDAQEMVATYKILCQQLGKVYTGKVPLKQMSAEIDKMTALLLEREEKAYITNAIVEAFEEEGIVLDDVKSAQTTQVFYMEESDDCEVVISNVDGGFLMETVGIYEQGTTVSADDQQEMKKNAKKVCEKYKRVIARLAEKGVIVDIVSEDDPEAYLKMREESSDTFVRRKQEKKDDAASKEKRRERRKKKRLQTFD